MKEIDYIQSLPFDKGCDYVYAWLKENKQGDYLDTLLRFKDFLIKEHRETLPLCPFTGCEGCDRKPHIIQERFDSGPKYSIAVYNTQDPCFCKSDFFKTKEEAIKAWKKAVGKDE